MTKSSKTKRGFTLMEMLIVVAIMVALIVVALPIFTHRLEDAKVAVDDANFRSAKAVAAALFMAEEDFSEVMYYDLENDRFVLVKPVAYGKTEEHSGMVITAKLNATGDGVTVQWE